MIHLQALSGTQTVDRVPADCPMCHHAIDPRPLTGVVLSAAAGGETVMEFVFQCPRSSCHRLFIGRYSGKYEKRFSTYVLRLRFVTPFVTAPPSHAEDIAKLSPVFVAIHAQAAAGEAHGLTEIAGCGYRKALEFLIKDYCVARDPDKADAIKGKLLGKVISDHISDPTIQECARRASWLGNDETHYVRRWFEKDITDLKKLIALTENWINTHLLTERYLREMPAAETKPSPSK